MSDVVNCPCHSIGVGGGKLVDCGISGAHFYAPFIRPVYVKFIDEDLEWGGDARCGRLNVLMDGARSVALHWHEHCGQIVLELPVVRGSAPVAPLIATSQI